MLHSVNNPRTAIKGCSLYYLRRKTEWLRSTLGFWFGWYRRGVPEKLCIRELWGADWRWDREIMTLAAWWGASILDSPIYWALRNPIDGGIVLGLLDIEIQIFNRWRIGGIGVSLYWRSIISIGSRNLVHWGLRSGLLTRWIFMKFVAFIHNNYKLTFLSCYCIFLQNWACSLNREKREYTLLIDDTDSLMRV